MKCKCGRKAEIKQLNIFNKIENLCLTCFNQLGETEVQSNEEPPRPTDVFYYSQMGIDDLLSEGDSDEC